MCTAMEDTITKDTRIDKKMGIHVMLTGQGCRAYSAKHDLMLLVRLLHALPRINFSRIDLAIDDFESKVISYTDINAHAKKGHMISRWSKWDEVVSRRTGDNTYLGRTMYFGSQASDLYCRVYDKTLERKAKAYEDIETEWTRLEVVYKRDRAKRLVEHLIDRDLPIGEALRGTLKQYLRFLTPGNDSNKSRWPSASWWVELLEDVASLTLTIKKDVKSIEDMADWVDRQIAPTMAAILTAHEGDLSWLHKIVAKGSKRLTRRHKDAISTYLQGGTV